jgi:putative transposase
MSRPLRLEHAGATWHVTSRGNARQEIFADDSDRRSFLRILSVVVRVRRWVIHAYVLMGNHYHLLVETPEPTLSSGMRDLNGFYTQSFNQRHERVGHLFQGRFRSILIEREAHLLELVRYIVLNPVRAGLVRRPSEWRWSNFSATAGLTRAPTWLEVTWTRSQFGNGPAGLQAYREYVADLRAAEYLPWAQLSGQVFLGGERFRHRMQRMVEAVPPSAETPRPQRCPHRPSLSEIVRATCRIFEVDAPDLCRMKRTAARCAIAYLAREDASLRLAAIAPHLGVGVSATSRLAALGTKRLADDDFRLHVERIRAEIWNFKT